MKRFQYALGPALEVARVQERAAADAFVTARVVATNAAALVVEVAIAANAIVAKAAERDRTCEPRATHPVHESGPARAARSLPPRWRQSYLDRERCLVALAARGSIAREIAAKTAWQRDLARDRFEARMLRRRTFEAHRERAFQAYTTALDLAEAADFDEANASFHEAGPSPIGKDDA